MKLLSQFSISLQRRFGRQRLRKTLLGSIPFLVLISIWHANTVFGWLPPVFVPTIGEVWDAIFFLQEDCPGFMPLIKLDNDCMMTTHVLSSLGRVILAAVVGLPAGIALGILADLFPNSWNPLAFLLILFLGLLGYRLPLFGLVLVGLPPYLLCSTRFSG